MKVDTNGNVGLEQKPYYLEVLGLTRAHSFHSKMFVPPTAAIEALDWLLSCYLTPNRAKDIANGGAMTVMRLEIAL